MATHKVQVTEAQRQLIMQALTAFDVGTLKADEQETFLRLIRTFGLLK